MRLPRWLAGVQLLRAAEAVRAGRDMDESIQLLEFLVAGRHLALPLDDVVRALRIVEITPLPESPSHILGAINVRGQVMPVISLRHHFGLPPREIELEDRLILVDRKGQTVALVVEAICGVIQVLQSQVRPPSEMGFATSYLEGLIQHQDDLVLVYEADRLLSPGEEKALAGNLDQAPIEAPEAHRAHEADKPHGAHEAQKPHGDHE